MGVDLVLAWGDGQAYMGMTWMSRQIKAGLGTDCFFQFAFH
jgi:hypothetical protein